MIDDDDFRRALTDACATDGARALTARLCADLEEAKALFVIFEAVAGGAALTLHGPRSVSDPSFNGFGASLGDVDAEAPTLSAVLVMLAAEWRER